MASTQAGLPNIGANGVLFTYSSLVSTDTGLVTELSVSSAAQRFTTVQETGYSSGVLYLAKAGAGLTNTASVLTSSTSAGFSIVALINGAATIVAHA